MNPFDKVTFTDEDNVVYGGIVIKVDNTDCTVQVLGSDTVVVKEESDLTKID